MVGLRQHQQSRRKRITAASLPLHSPTSFRKSSQEVKQIKFVIDFPVKMLRHFHLLPGTNVQFAVTVYPFWCGCSQLDMRRKAAEERCDIRLLNSLAKNCFIRIGIFFGGLLNPKISTKDVIQVVGGWINSLISKYISCKKLIVFLRLERNVQHLYVMKLLR